MTQAPPLLQLGTVLAGRWLLQDFIGTGETGEVYGVRDMHGASSFALKLFWPDTLVQTDLWSVLQLTARSASAIHTEGIARAFDFGIDANSARPFFVAEHVSWPSLAARVTRSGPLTPAEMSIALDVLGRALDTAHATGIVHRDLKPENVFVAPDNAAWVRISDFGVAVLRCASPPPPGWAGTLGWVGPDAADPNAASTPAMDVFAIGLVTFFALTGGALHRAARAKPIDAGALWHELGAPLDSASVRARELGAALDPAFDTWFQRAVATLPQERFLSVGEMASAFRQITGSLFAPASPSAVALPGIAAAIAQPLVFQPEAAPALPPVSSAERASNIPEPSSHVPKVESPRRKRATAPLWLGGAALCFALTAVGAVAVYRDRQATENASAAAFEVARSAASVAQAGEPNIAMRPGNAIAGDSAEAAPAPASTHLQPAGEEPTSDTSAIAVTPEPLNAIHPASAVPSRAAMPPKASVAMSATPAALPAKKKCQSTFIPCKG